MHYQDGLETKRLRTRFLQKDDIPGWIPYFADPINCTFMPNAHLPPEQRASDMITKALNRYANGKYGLQALILKDTGEWVGCSGLLIQEPDGITEVEVGYHLFRKHWGKGYAIEVATLFRDYGFENGFADTIISVIHPLNFLSKKVAERNGMSVSKKGVIYMNGEYDIHRIDRDEWQRIKD